MKLHYNQILLFKPFKKQFILTMTLVFFAIGTNAQITIFPWTETFEDDSPSRDSWTQIYEVNNMSWTYETSPSTGGWLPGSSGAYEGTKFANYPGTSHNFDKTKLVSPVLDLSAVTDPSISFYYRNPFWSPDQNWLRVFYRISDTDPWIQITEFHSDVVPWTSSGDIALPDPSATYQIAIECETDYGYSTTVDSLVVTGTLGVNHFLKSTVSFYPNPAENILNFSSHEIVSDINVFNLLGQKVLETKVDSNQGQIDISNLASGNYIVRANAQSGTQLFRVVKK